MLVNWYSKMIDDPFSGIFGLR